MENPVTTLISKNPSNGNRKLNLLMVGNNPFIASPGLQSEIELSETTLADAKRNIAGSQAAIDAVVVVERIDFSEIVLLRDATARKNLPLILFTARFDQRIKDMAMKLGIDDYFYDSMARTVASRIRFIKRLREYRIQWLKCEHERRTKKNEMINVPFFFLRRTLDIIVSLIVLILLSPVILIISLALETESMVGHIFFRPATITLGDRIYDLYELMVMAIFSPLFLIISIPLKIGSKEGRILSVSKCVGLGYRVFTLYKFRTELINPDDERKKPITTWLGLFLIKSGLAELPELFNVLKGDMSLIGSKPLSMNEAVRLTKDQDAQQFLSPAGLMRQRF